MKTAPSPLEHVLSLLEGCCHSGNGWIARCPAHSDAEPSLSIAEGEDGRVLLNCHAGCTTEGVVKAIGLSMPDLFVSKVAASKMRRGLGVAAYARHLGLQKPFLNDLGLTDVSKRGTPCISIPYRDTDGSVLSTRYRHVLAGKRRFSWKPGNAVCLYGLDRLAGYDKDKPLLIVEGESDCHVLWSNGYQAVGLPGADTWKSEWASHLSGFGEVVFIQERDDGGRTLGASIASDLPLARITVLDGAKDSAELWRENKSEFKRLLDQAISTAIPIERVANGDAVTVVRARDRCKTLLASEDVLGEFRREFSWRGVDGFDDEACLIFLAMCSRVLDRPVSVIVMGSSSSGKSFLVDNVRAFFPEECYRYFSSISGRALEFEKDLSHKMLIFAEWEGVKASGADYSLRTLLSEHKLVRGTVLESGGKLQKETKSVVGPVGAIITTTEVSLHPETSGRFIPIELDDSPEMLKRRMVRRAECPVQPLVSEMWHDLQVVLEADAIPVSVPFMSTIARLTRVHAPRQQRDSSALRSLIEIHALLHRHQRPVSGDGGVVAVLGDYEKVYELVKVPFSEAAEQAVPAHIRHAVESVQKLSGKEQSSVSVTALMKHAGRSRSTWSRNLRIAASLEYVSYDRGRVRILRRVDADQYVLPTPKEVATKFEAN